MSIQRCNHRVVRVGPVEVYQLAGSLGIRAPGWGLVAVPTLAWMRRGCWWSGWVGYCWIARFGPFTLTVWYEVPAAVGWGRQQAWRRQRKAMHEIKKEESLAR